MTSTQPTTPRTRPLNIAYLVIGMVYIGVSLTWLLDETGVIEPDGYEWLVPAVLLGAGLVGLFASIGKGMFGRRHAASAPAPTYTHDHSDTQNGELS